MSIIPDTLPRRVVLTDDPLRARMLSAHHLEYSTLVYEAGNVLIYTGDYKNAAIALVSTGFGSSAVLSYLRLLEGRGVEEVVFIGGCVSTINRPVTNRPRLRAVILAAGGSQSLSDRALIAAKQYEIPIRIRTVMSPDDAHPEEGCIIDDITGALYEQARVYGIEALSVLTLTENIKTGEKIEEHEKRSRFYAAARLVFETFALGSYDQHSAQSG